MREIDLRIISWQVAVKSEFLLYTQLDYQIPYQVKRCWSTSQRASRSIHLWQLYCPSICPSHSLPPALIVSNPLSFPSFLLLSCKLAPTHLSIYLLLASGMMLAYFVAVVWLVVLVAGMCMQACICGDYECLFG